MTPMLFDGPGPEEDLSPAGFAGGQGRTGEEVEAIATGAVILLVILMTGIVAGALLAGCLWVVDNIL